MTAHIVWTVLALVCCLAATVARQRGASLDTRYVLAMLAWLAGIGALTTGLTWAAIEVAKRVAGS